MCWNLKYAIRTYISGSMWLVPLFALLLYKVFAQVTTAIEDWLLRTGRLDATTAYLGLPMAGARSMLETVVTLNLSFLVFALRVLTRTEEIVDQFNTFIATLLGWISILAFLYLIDYAARFLRPVSIVAEVGGSASR
jgi:hypothetical protein